MDQGDVAPREKKAARLKAGWAVLDESGVLMAPLVRRTWSPQGHPPVLSHRARAHQKGSVIAALCVSPSRDRVRLYVRLHANRNVAAPEVVAFLRHLRHHVDGPIVRLWDRLQAHRARAVQTFLTSAWRIHPVFFPP
jgi:hypothetical protein